MLRGSIKLICLGMSYNMNRLCLSLGDKLLLLAFFLAYFSGLLKLLGGSTILLLTDFLLLLVLFLKSPIIYQKINGIRACVLSLGILLLVSIAIFEVFNPNVRDFVYALKGLRVNVFIFIYFFVGLSIGRKTTYVIYFFKMISFLV